MVKSKLFYFFMVVSCLYSPSNYPVMNKIIYNIEVFLRVSVLTTTATGVAYAPIMGYLLLKGKDKAWLYALKPAIYSGASFMSIFFSGMELIDDSILQCIKSKKLYMGRTFAGIGATAFGLWKIKDYLERKYG